ncbi:MAG: hypothetical protein U0326_44665, partial [Polyangiales bacterium]
MRRTLLASLVLPLSIVASGCAETTVSSDAAADRDDVSVVDTSPLDATRADVSPSDAPTADASADASADSSPACAPRDGGMAPPVDYAALAVTAAANATLAQPLLLHSRAWLTAELTHVDATSNLLMDTLDLSATWSTRDTGADIYPFFAWEAYLLDSAVFEGPVRAVLDAERARTVVPATGRLPYDFDTRTQMRVLRDVNDPHFGAAEYAKDGLTPIVELVGRGPYADRMQEIELD